jgi:Transposase DDE domain group 1
LTVEFLKISKSFGVFERLGVITTSTTLLHGGFRVKKSIARQLASRKRRIKERLARANRDKYERSAAQAGPVFEAPGVKYELAHKARGIAYGGVGLMVKLAQEVGLVEAIDRRLHLLKVHVPYHESDHVLNLALNALCDATCLQDLELRRNDEVFLDAVGTDSIPDPTTEGDFCRRFDADSLDDLRHAIDDARLNVWRRQADDFFAEAVIDLDGTFVITTGECKEGMDVSYKGEWGYHPLLVSLANTGETLDIINRSGNRPSEEGAAAAADRAIRLCRRGGFRRTRLRGDTAFSQTQYLDGWDAAGVLFQFGYDAMPNLVEIAENLPESAWQKLSRPPPYQRAGPRRARPDKVKRKIIRRRDFLHKELQSEQVAEFDYRPLACKKSYRMIVVRKNITQEKGVQRLFDEVRYFFYITNDRSATPAQIVFGCNDRCDQENLIAQLAGGVRALAAPVDNLVSNGAYMLMTSLAWTLKAWSALLLPVEPRKRAEHQAERHAWLRMEFKTFINAVMQIPCQIVRQARRTIYRVLNWNPYLPAFFRLCQVLRC